MTTKVLCEFKERSQITIPNKLVKKLDLKPGDILEINENNGVIYLTPSFVVPKSQSWFFSKEWQEEEKEIDESLKAKEGIQVSDKEELFKVLDLIS